MTDAINSIAYLGPEGTYCNEAALAFAARIGAADVELQPCASFTEVFESVERGKCTYGVVALENSLEGPVTATLDNFAFSSSAQILGVHVVDIRHCLVAQKGVVDLIALLIHSTGSTVFITTHSPYILTSANLCAYSAKVESSPKLPRKRDDIVIPEYLRIPPEKYNAFMTPDRNTRSETGQFLDCIKEPESGLIDAARIDEVSSLINGDTDRLIDLEVQYDL